MQSHVKRRLELNDRAGIKMNKSFNSFVVEGGGHENLTFQEKDCRNYIDKVRCLRFGEGNATAIHNYFLKMQADNSEFFYIMDLDDEGRVKNVFLADARSRAAFKEFGDVVTFDTMHLTNSAIIIDQDRAMKKAIEIVFPSARHRRCLWHIMKKLPEKLSAHKDYKAIKFCIRSAMYDSLTILEFEESWQRLIASYNLEDNEWLCGLYDEKNRWVPAFVKDTFWAGISPTQRSESMNAFFDGYVNSKTSLKQFV